MKVHAFEFKGPCDICRGNPGHVRGGVEVEGSNPLWLCLECAEKFARRLLKQVDACKRNQESGQEYRFNVWRKPRPAAEPAGTKEKA
jgi:hypothetical protein